MFGKKETATQEQVEPAASSVAAVETEACEVNAREKYEAKAGPITRVRLFNLLKRCGVTCGGMLEDTSDGGLRAALNGYNGIAAEMCTRVTNGDLEALRPELLEYFQGASKVLLAERSALDGQSLDERLTRAGIEAFDQLLNSVEDMVASLDSEIEGEHPVIEGERRPISFLVQLDEQRGLRGEGYPSDIAQMLRETFGITDERAEKLVNAFAKAG